MAMIVQNKKKTPDTKIPTVAQMILKTLSALVQLMYDASVSVQHKQYLSVMQEQTIPPTSATACTGAYTDVQKKG